MSTYHVCTHIEKGICYTVEILQYLIILNSIILCYVSCGKWCIYSGWQWWDRPWRNGGHLQEALQVRPPPFLHVSRWFTWNPWAGLNFFFYNVWAGLKLPLTIKSKKQVGIGIHDVTLLDHAFFRHFVSHTFSPRNVHASTTIVRYTYTFAG